MLEATIRSVCECQSRLDAILDEHRYVLAGFATGLDGVRERAPAHSIDAQKKRFDVAWLCPVCGRNTLRSFSAEGLAWVEGAPPAPAATPPVLPPPAPGPGPATSLSGRPYATLAARANPATAPRSVPPPNAATAVALKSLTSPSRPPPSSNAPPRPPSEPPKRS